MQSLLVKLQADVEARKRPRWDGLATLKSALVGGAICLCAFLLGARSTATAEGAGSLRAVYGGPPPAEGMVDLQRVEIERLKRIYANSSRFAIPADLAERIEDIARAEGIEPEVAFGLVRVESEFNRRAVSPVGAVGYTQLMPSTARYFQRGVRRENLFDRDTNLRIGFRFLRTLIDKYDGNLHLALLAYNRGPERVDQLLRQGINPDNGYPALVLGKNAARKARARR